MSTTPSRVFAARLVGLPIFDPQGDQVGKVRDLVVALRSEISQPRVLGLVAEVFGRRRIFVPMTRVTNIDSGQVYTTGLLNMRRFEQRPTETLVIGQMLDRTVTIPQHRRHRHGLRRGDGAGPQPRLGAQPGRGPGAGQGPAPARPDPRRGVARRRRADPAASQTQGATHLIAALNEMRPADAANVIHDLPPERRTAVVAALDDERLADVLEELPEEDQVEILEHLDSERAADVLEEMSADDAADLIADLPPETAADPARADGARGGRGRAPADGLRRGDRRRHDDARAGDPAARTPRWPRRWPTCATEELPPSLAAHGLRLPPPLETPTGKLLGRRPHPAPAARAPVDPGRRRRSTRRWTTSAPRPRIEDVAVHLATYNLVAAPVVDEDGRLLGAVTVDDLLDHMLPESWRDRATAPRAPRAQGDRG